MNKKLKENGITLLNKKYKELINGAGILDNENLNFNTLNKKEKKEYNTEIKDNIEKYKNQIINDLINKSFSKFNFTLKYFDQKSKKNIFGGYHKLLSNNEEGIYQSNDYGKTFRFKPLAKFDLRNNVYPIYQKIYNYPELYKRGNNYISYNHKTRFADSTQIFLYNENFDLLEWGAVNGRKWQKRRADK